MKNLFLIVFAALICSCHFGGDKNILLRLKYDKYRRIDIKYRDYLITDNENDDPLKNEYLRMGLTVDSVINDSAYLFSAKIDYVRVKNGGLMKEEYSSDKDESGMKPGERQIHQQFKPVLDSVYKFTLNKRGQVVKPFSFAGGRAIPPQYALLNLNIYQIKFPEEKIAIGDEWTNEWLEPKVDGKRISTYHIESVYEQTIQIKVEGTLILPRGESQDFSGRYYLNRKTCTLDSCNIEIKAGSFLHGKLKAVTTIVAN